MEVGYLRDYAFDIRIQQLTKGFGLPVYQTPLDIPTIPSLIQQALPKIGPINLAQGSLEVSFLNTNQIVYECTLIDAFPTTMNTIELGNGQEENIMELGVQLSYKNWVSTANPRYKTQSFMRAQTENLLNRLF